LTTTRVARTRESSGGEDRPCATAPVDAGPVRGYPALKRSRQGQAATRSPSASLDPPTGPGPETSAALAAPGGLRPHPPGPSDNRARDYREVIAQALGKARDQQRSHKSSTPELPLDLCDDPGETCTCGAVVWTAADGKITGRYKPGKRKGCGVCGRRLRARYWQGFLQVLGAAGTLNHLVIGERGWTEQGPDGKRRPGHIQRRIRKGGWQALPIPLEHGGRYIFTDCPDLGEPVTDLPGQLLAALLAMTDDPARRMRATGSKERPGWRQAWQETQKATAPPAAGGEHVGLSGAVSIPYARMRAQHYGILESAGDDQHLVIRDVRESDPATWRRFVDEVGIRKYRRGRDEAMAA
jgi:hypothetical protein